MTKHFLSPFNSRFIPPFETYLSIGLLVIKHLSHHDSMMISRHSQATAQFFTGSP